MSQGRRTHIEIVQEHGFSAHVFWKLYMSFEFRRRVLLEGLGFASVTLDEKSDLEDVRFTRLSVVPNFALPHVLVQLVGPRFAYVEESHFDKNTRDYRFRILPSGLGDRMTLEGSIAAADTSAGGSICTVSVDHTALVSGLGGLLEHLLARTATKTMRGSWARAAPFLEAEGPRWFDKLSEEEKVRIP